MMTGRPAGATGTVALWRQAECRYPGTAPYHPPERYPELPFATAVDPSNRVFESVRNLFLLSGYDTEHAGSAAWNPLGWLIRPGDTVFLKPNMISHKHRLTDDWEHVITHGSVIRAVTDYVVRALDGKGTVIIGDAPQTDSLIDLLRERQGLEALRRHYRDACGITVELLDLRDTHHVDRDGIYVETVTLEGDPRGGVAFDLAQESMFAELDGRGKRYYGAYYDWRETNERHRNGRHEYAISRSPLTADVFINLPKLKTHKKCGITVNLKSLVGINANKNWLPHYAFGAPGWGGDQYDRMSLPHWLENAVVVPSKLLLTRNLPWFKNLARRSKRVGYDLFGDTESVVRSGNWHGNDTVWRMCLDLNRILLYGLPDGTMRSDGITKRFFSVVDGIVGMDGNGPVAGEAKHSGVLLCGRDPVAVDAVAAAVMGFDVERLQLVARAFDAHRWPLTQTSLETIEMVSNHPAWHGPLHTLEPGARLGFRPHFGWVGHCEARPC